MAAHVCRLLCLGDAGDHRRERHSAGLLPMLLPFCFIRCARLLLCGRGNCASPNRKNYKITELEYFAENMRPCMYWQPRWLKPYRQLLCLCLAHCRHVQVVPVATPSGVLGLIPCRCWFKHYPNRLGRLLLEPISGGFLMKLPIALLWFSEIWSAIRAELLSCCCADRTNSGYYCATIVAAVALCPLSLPALHVVCPAATSPHETSVEHQYLFWCFVAVTPWYQCYQRLLLRHARNLWITGAFERHLSTLGISQHKRALLDTTRTPCLL